MVDRLDETLGGPDVAAQARYKTAFWRSLHYQLLAASFDHPAVMLQMTPYLSQMPLRYWSRLLLLASASFVGQPLWFAERLRYGRRIIQTQIDRSPIFIIGHWRSGTTHLHNLFSQDPSLGFVTNSQALAPGFSLIGGTWLKRLLSLALPQRRPMDNMALPIDWPQEEEIALAKTTAYSYYAQLRFPPQAYDFLTKHVLAASPSKSIAMEVRKKYLHILKVATVHAGGRRLVLKNPINSARIPMLLELFPDAKFIHIHRSPYQVYSSMRHMADKIIGWYALQPQDETHITEHVLGLYEGLMRRLFSDRVSIRRDNFAEVAFADLERDPMGEMARLYETLSLPGFTEAEPMLQSYIASQAQYRRNSFHLPANERARVAGQWGFAFAELGYTREEVQEEEA
jgi:hypothetical protein